jgi:amino acid transporter
MNASIREAPTIGKRPTESFKRILRRRDLILFGLAILTPTAAFPVYGIIQTVSHGQAVLSYLAAMIAMLLTAVSYGRMAAAFPSAGSTYTYVQQSFEPQIGFFAGWAMVLDYFLIPLTSVVYGGLTAHRLIPEVPYIVWAVLFTVGIATVNVLGVELMVQANNVMTAVMVLSAIAFVVVAIRYVESHYGAPSLISSVGVLQPHGFSLHSIMRGASIAALSYIGFDAISTLAEDSVNAERDIGISTVIACAIQTLACIAIVYVAALAWNDYSSFPMVATAILDIGRRIGGEAMFLVITIGLLVAGLSSALTGQAGSSRLLFAMGREGTLPRAMFGHLHKRFGTPARAIYIMSAATLIFVIAGSIYLGDQSFEVAVEMLNFGAFIGFILVNLSVVRHFFFHLKQRAGIRNVIRNLCFPAAGAISCAYIWWNLSPHAKLAGFLWLGIGVVYLAFLTRGFTRRLELGMGRSGESDPPPKTGLA